MAAALGLEWIGYGCDSVRGRGYLSRLSISASAERKKERNRLRLGNGERCSWLGTYQSQSAGGFPPQQGRAEQGRGGDG